MFSIRPWQEPPPATSSPARNEFSARPPSPPSAPRAPGTSRCGSPRSRRAPGIASGGFIGGGRGGRGRRWPQVLKLEQGEGPLCQSERPNAPPRLMCISMAQSRSPIQLHPPMRPRISHWGTTTYVAGVGVNASSPSFHCGLMTPNATAELLCKACSTGKLHQIESPRWSKPTFKQSLGNCLKTCLPARQSACPNNLHSRHFA